jgi:hypothetical protein
MLLISREETQVFNLRKEVLEIKTPVIDSATFGPENNAQMDDQLGSADDVHNLLKHAQFFLENKHENQNPSSEQLR